MADNSALRRREARGKQAEKILQDDLVKEAFEMIERRVYEAWKSTTPEDDRARHDCYLMHQIFGDFQDFFKAAVTKGKTATTELIRTQKANHSQKDT